MRGSPVKMGDSIDATWRPRPWSTQRSTLAGLSKFRHGEWVPRAVCRPACRSVAAPARRAGSCLHCNAMMTPELLRASWRSWFTQDFRPIGPAWLQLVWTFVFSAIVALAFTLLGTALNAGRLHGLDGLAASVGKSYLENLVVSLCAGYAIHGLLVV